MMSVCEADMNAGKQSKKPSKKYADLRWFHVLGCPTYCSTIILSPDGRGVVFACETLVIVMDLELGRQHMLPGKLTVILSTLNEYGTFGV